jgi:hypothetical protein
MAQTISKDILFQEVMNILEETFDTHHGIYLDAGTSLLETLAQMSAAEASVPAGINGSTIAAQVEHVVFYLDVLEKFMTGQDVGNPDWRDIWERVGGVTPDEWEDLKTRLKAAYDRTRALFHSIENWEDNDAVGGSIGILVHTAYHLGEVRATIYTVRQSGR